MLQLVSQRKIHQTRKNYRPVSVLKVDTKSDKFTLKKFSGAIPRLPQKRL